MCFFFRSFSKLSMSMSIIVLSKSIDRSEVVFLLFDYDVKTQLKAATNKFFFSVQILLIFKRITYRINMLFFRALMLNLWDFKSRIETNFDYSRVFAVEIVEQTKVNKWWNIGEHHFNMNEFLAWEFRAQIICIYFGCSSLKCIWSFHIP